MENKILKSELVPEEWVYPPLYFSTLRTQCTLEQIKGRYTLAPSRDQLIFEEHRPRQKFKKQYSSIELNFSKMNYISG